MALKTAEKSAKTPLASRIHGMPGLLIRRLHQASQAVFDAEMAAAGIDLTSVQFAALSVIVEHPGLDQATLADAIAFDRATTGGVIDRLEAKGLVRRVLTRADRRSRLLHPEEAGRQLLAAALPIVERAQAAILAGLARRDQAELLRLIERALAGIDVAAPGQPRKR